MDDMEFFRFRVPDLHEDTLSTLSEIRKCRKPYDIAIKVGTASFAAHRDVLASVIPFFRAMFHSKMAETENNEISMEYIDAAALKSLIDFAYLGYLKIPIHKLPHLAKAAAYLQIDSVASACFDYLWQHICPENALKVYECAHSCINAEIMERSECYITEYFAAVSRSQKFYSLSFYALKKLLRNEAFYALNREIIFESLIRWVNAAKHLRRRHLPELLPYVRMSELPPRYLGTRVCTEELIRTSPVCKHLVKEARNSQLFQRHDSKPCGFDTQENYCKEEHHLQCVERTGYRMYLVSFSEREKMSVNYYDDINNRWTDLYCTNWLEYSDYVVCTEDVIYFIGIQHTQTLHLETLKYCASSRADYIPASAGVTLQHGKIYFIGGNFSDSDLVHSFDLPTGVCSNIGKIEVNRTLPAAALLGDNIYVTGGCSEDNTQAHNSAEKYNIISGKSTMIASMNCARYGHGCISHRGKIYVYGGKSISGCHNVHLNSVEVYDPSTDEWKLIRKLKSAKRSVSFFSSAKELYVIDADSQIGNVLEVQSYDPDNDRWNDEQFVTLPSSSQTSAVVFQNSAKVF